MDSSLQTGTSIAERLQNPLAQWTEALASFARGLRVALPGIVQSFDAGKQTVTVQPALREVPKIAGVRTVKDLPLLVDVPVVLPRAGGFALTLPIQAGDECLVVFADMCIDAWYQSGGVQNQVEQRRHTLSDGIAIIGLWSQPRKLANYVTNAAELRSDDGATKVQVVANAVTVTAQTITVNASGTATVQGATVNVTGSSQVNISGGGNTTIEGKDWLTHRHTGVGSGPSQSGPVA